MFSFTWQSDKEFYVQISCLSTMAMHLNQPQDFTNQDDATRNFATQAIATQNFFNQNCCNH